MKFLLRSNMLLILGITGILLSVITGHNGIVLQISLVFLTVSLSSKEGINKNI